MNNELFFILLDLYPNEKIFLLKKPNPAGFNEIELISPPSE